MWVCMQTSGTFGGFLLFSPETGSGAETYWDSPPHVAFGPTYVSTVSLDADDRGAATVQVTLPYDQFSVTSLEIR